MGTFPWQLPLGARPVGRGRVEFRVWAPKATEVAVRLRAVDHALAHDGYGVWSTVAPARPGDDYSFLLDGRRFPDPCTRLQAKGLRGPSRIVDPREFEWTDAGWPGLTLDPGLVLYELHVGTFTGEGTFEGVIPHLAHLRELGVRAIELMPIAAFPGEHGWGYDGVYPFSAQASYGGPAGLAALVDAAHAAGLGVILDVVYNHVGASGARGLRAFGPYFTDRYTTAWGEAMNYDGEDSEPVREWVFQSAEHWIRELHIDGLRLDAIHAIFDSGARPLLAELADRVRRVNPRALVIAESGLNDPKVIRAVDDGGLGLDAQWADDFHHALRTLITDERDGYYAEFGKVADLAKAMRRPFVHDGTWSSFRRRRFGAPAHDRPPEQFVVFIQNHDQVGNRAFGDRLPREARPLGAFCVLLSPFTPMLFMGEEYGEPAPFQFFTDHIDKRIARATRDGRRREFAAFAAFAGEEVPDPQDPATRERSTLTRQEDPGLRKLYGALLRERRRLRGEAHVIGFDERRRWLRVRRGRHELVMNFADGRRRVPVDRDRIVLATHAGVRVSAGRAELPALSGALLR